MRYNKKYGVFLLAALLFAIILCSTVSAANETNATDVNSSIKTLQAQATVNSTGTAQNTSLPAYSGNASSYVLNVGVLPNVLLDVYAGKSNSSANSTISYASSENTPLEVKLLNGSLLSGLLNVKSTGDQGKVTGGITPSNLPALLQVLGLKVGLLNSTAYSSTHPPQAGGGSDVASVDLNLLNLLPVLNVSLISANSNVTPNANITAVISSSKAGVADITLLGGVLQIKALQVNATASANGQPGGADAKFSWSVADILLNGKSILSDLRLKLKVDLPGVLTISIGNPVKTIAADGTSASVSGDAINVELLGLLLGGVKLTIGHAEASAQFIGGSDLSMTKTVDNATPKYNQNVTFTLTAHNNGPNNATGVTVVDKLPDGLKFISADGAYNSTTGVWTIGSLAKGATAILHIVAQAIAANTKITNIAVIGGNQTDSNSSNNQGNVTVNVGPASDLGITITVNKPNPKYLEKVIFTITASNNGPNDAPNVKVYNTLPAGLKYISDDANGKFNSTTGLWSVGPMAIGTTKILRITAQAIVSNASVIDKVRITDPPENDPNDFYDPNDSNNNAEVSVDVGPATDLGITKTVSDPTPDYLQNVTFTLTAHNNGPNAATGVSVYDTLPDGLKFVSADGAYNATTGEWAIGSLANGATAALHIVAQVVVSNVQLTNLAAISGAEVDNNSTNDQSNVTVSVGPASDLSITKTVNNATPKYLDTVTFTLTAHNNGPDAAAGIVATDVLPVGLKFVSADGAYNSTTGKWTIGSLAKNADAILHIVVQVVVSNGQLTNIAAILGNNYDQNSTNNEDNITVNVDTASDLGITKTASSSKIKYLQNVTFTLTAHNYGPNAAAGIVVTDVLPAGLKFVSADGAYNSITGKWTIGSLASGAAATLHIVAQGITASTTITNIAVINGTNYDQNSTNNQGNVTVAVGPASDLGITMAVSNGHPKYLQNVIFTLNAVNNGPNPAPNVKVYVTLPAKLRFVSADGAYNATYNSTTGLWSIGPMAVGATKTLRITAQAMEANVVLTAKAWITDPPEAGSNDFYDPFNGNDNADVSVDVGANSTSTDIKKPAKTIPLQPTGIPLAGMLLAAFIVFAGMARPKR